MASAPASAAASTKASARSREPLWLPDISATTYGRLSTPNLVISPSLRPHDRLDHAVDVSLVAAGLPESEPAVQRQHLLVLGERFAAEALQPEHAERVLDRFLLQPHPGGQHTLAEAVDVEIKRPRLAVEDHDSGRDAVVLVDQDLIRVPGPPRGVLGGLDLVRG